MDEQKEYKFHKLEGKEPLDITNPHTYYGIISNHSVLSPVVIDGEEYKSVSNYIYSSMLREPKYKNLLKTYENYNDIYHIYRNYELIEKDIERKMCYIQEYKRYIYNDEELKKILQNSFDKELISDNIHLVDIFKQIINHFKLTNKYDICKSNAEEAYKAYYILEKMKKIFLDDYRQFEEIENEFHNKIQNIDDLYNLVLDMDIKSDNLLHINVFRKFWNKKHSKRYQFIIDNPSKSLKIIKSRYANTLLSHTKHKREDKQVIQYLKNVSNDINPGINLTTILDPSSTEFEKRRETILRIINKQIDMSDIEEYIKNKHIKEVSKQSPQDEPEEINEKDNIMELFGKDEIIDNDTFNIDQFLKKIDTKIIDELVIKSCLNNFIKYHNLNIIPNYKIEDYTKDVFITNTKKALDSKFKNKEYKEILDTHNICYRFLWKSDNTLLGVDIKGNGDNFVGKYLQSISKPTLKKIKSSQKFLNKNINFEQVIKSNILDIWINYTIHLLSVATIQVSDILYERIDSTSSGNTVLKNLKKVYQLYFSSDDYFVSDIDIPESISTKIRNHFVDDKRIETFVWNMLIILLYKIVIKSESNDISPSEVIMYNRRDTNRRIEELKIDKFVDDILSECKKSNHTIINFITMGTVLSIGGVHILISDSQAKIEIYNAMKKLGGYYTMRRLLLFKQILKICK